MDHNAYRVKAFFERTVAYQRRLNEIRKQLLGMEAEAQEAGASLDDNVLYQKTREKKLELDNKLMEAKSQAFDVIQAGASLLTPKQARVMDLRYKYSRSWEYIRLRMGYDSLRTVEGIRDDAYKALVPALDKLYPNWQIGDE